VIIKLSRNFEESTAKGSSKRKSLFSLFLIKLRWGDMELAS